MKVLKMVLNHYCMSIKFTLDKILLEGSNISNYDWLVSVKNKDKEKKKNFEIVCMFSSYCHSCKGAFIVSTLNNMYSIFNNQLNISLYFYNKLSEQDIDNFKSQLSVEYSVFNMEGNLKDKWESLINYYSKEELNDFILVLNKDGLIKKVFHFHCGCYKKLSQYIKELIHDSKE